MKWFRIDACLLVLAVLLGNLRAVGAAEPVRSRRSPWTTSRVHGVPEVPLPYAVELAFPKLAFTRPATLTSAPGTPRLFLVEVEGKLYSFPNDPHVARADPLLDLRAHVPDLVHVYGLAFHPDFKSNRYLYLMYTRKERSEGSCVSRFVVKETDPPVVDIASEQVIFTWLGGGHNGCALKFGPDGYLYISTGDGTGPNPPDPDGVGQDLSNVLSAILRIDVDQQEAGRPYRVPPDNPFVSLPGARPEIWAYGFRNPWKMSFDRHTGDLWVADVGWEMWEMVYRVRRGGNYGWSVMEGPQPVHPEGKRGPTPILPPVKAHDHFEARSITGGFVYRGTRLEALAGAYIYGDYSTGKLWGLRYDGERLTWFKELVDTSLQIVAFGEDHDGELYIVDYERTGRIYRLIPNRKEDNSQAFPRTLSATGLFTSVADENPAPGVIPYAVNAEMWQDHATARRLLALPDDSQITLRSSQKIFPEGTVIARTVSLDLEQGNPARRRRLETQLLHFENETWRPYTYVWNEDETETDAVLADPAGFDLDLTIRDATTPTGRREQTWRVASRAECSVCHTDKLAALLGFDPLQLDRVYDYGQGPENQLAAWLRLGILAEPVPVKDREKRMVDPHDPVASLAHRARSYLHVNCRHCHRPGGGGTSMIHLDFARDINRIYALDQKPAQGDFGLAGARIITPGDPFASVLYYRMAKLGRGRMPHIGSRITDRAGLELIYNWIEQLEQRPVVDKPAGSPRVDVPATADVVGATLREDDIPKALSSTRGALMLARRMEKGQVSQGVQKHAVTLGTSHIDVNVRDLFERFVPPAERTQRLGDAIDPAAILSLAGDPERGRRLYFFGAASGCMNCHQVHAVGGKLGPDLTKIGEKYKRRELLEAILEPSKQIEDAYRSYVLVTHAGDIYTGLLAEKTDQEIILEDASRDVIRVPVGEVARFEPQHASIMPDLLLSDLTAQEAADLLAYLSMLK